MTVLAEAISTLHTELTDGGNRPLASLRAVKVAAVYDHEPGFAGLPTNVSVTIAPAPQCMNATDVTVRVRLYAKVNDPKTAQDALVAALDVLDDLPSDSYSHAGWEYGYIEELGCFVAFTDIAYPRDDL